MKPIKNYLAAFIFTFLLLPFSFNVCAQNVGINSKGNKPSSNAVLDLRTGNLGSALGFLPNEVSLSATNSASPFSTPDTGLIVYNYATTGTAPNNVVPGYYYWTGSAWVMMLAPNGGTAGQVLTSNGGGAPSWSPVPNTVYGAGTGIRIRNDSIINTEPSQWTVSGNNIYNSNSGYVGIGLNTPNVPLQVYQPATGISGYNSNDIQPYSIIRMDGNSGDGVIDMGQYNTSPYAGWIQASYGSGTNPLSLNPQGGNVGIGTSSPSKTLQVLGTTETTNFEMTNGATSGYVLQSDASGNGTWVKPTTYTAGTGIKISNDTISSTQSSGAVNYVGTSYLGLNSGAGSTGTSEGTSSNLYNINVGYKAGNHNQTGIQNIAIGNNTLSANDKVNCEIAIGDSTLNNLIYSGTVHDGDIAIGHAALASQNYNFSNIAIGYEAMAQSADGGNDVAIGFYALQSASASNDYVCAVGYQSMMNAQDADHSNAFGYQSLINDNGGKNSAFGYQAGQTVGSGTNNTLIGYQADVASGSLTNATAIGANAVADSSNTVTLGNNSVVSTEMNGALKPYYSGAYHAGTSGQVLTSQGPDMAPQWKNASGGSGAVNYVGTSYLGITSGAGGTGTNEGTSSNLYNINIGDSSGYGMTSGVRNIFLGDQAGYANKNLNDNIAIGTNTLQSNILANKEIAIGTGALQYIGTIYADFPGLLADVAIGYQAMGGVNCTLQSSDIAIGYQALYSGGYVENVAVGNQAQFSNQLGEYNSAFGNNALYSNNAGNNLSAFGYRALYNNNSSGDNSAFGYEAGDNVTSGTENTFLGSLTNVTTGGLSNATAIGYNAIVGESNAIVLGNGASVGIGTSYPSAILHTVASGAKTANFSGNLLTNTATSGTASVTKAGVEIQSTGTWNGIFSSNIGLYVSSVTGGVANYDAIFDGGGNVGIGTTSPTSPLEVAGTAQYIAQFQNSNSTGTWMVLNNTTTGGIPWNIISTGSGNGEGAGNLLLRDNSNVRMIVQSSTGNVGIGTSSPTAILHTVASGAKTANYSGNLLTNTATSSTASITKAALELQSSGTWNGSSGRNIGLYVSSTTGGAYNFDAIFNGGGNVGIGITYPTAILHTVASGAKTANYYGNILTNTATSSTASITKSGLEVQSTGSWTGSSASNIGIYVSSVTGGTNNYDAIFNGGGNVGIGTASPAAQLDISSTNNNVLSLESSGGGGTKLQLNNTSSGGKNWYIMSTGSSNAIGAGNLLFQNGNYDYFVINDNGYIGIGNDMPNYILDVEGSVNGPNGYVASVINWDDNGNTNCNTMLLTGGVDSYNGNNSSYLTFDRPDGTYIGHISQESTNSVTYSTSSDERLKENIKPTTFGLNDLLKIEVKDYYYKDDKEKRFPQTGYLAQQLYTVFPNAVSKGGDDAKKNPWMVDYGRITPLLVKSIQDQQQIIDEQNKKLDAQQQQIDELKKAVEQLQQNKK